MDHYLELEQTESTTMTETHVRGYHPRENGRVHDRVLLAKTQSVETSEEGTLSELPSRSRSRYRGALSQETLPEVHEQSIARFRGDDLEPRPEP